MTKLMRKLRAQQNGVHLPKDESMKILHFVCDLYTLNKLIERPSHPFPTSQDII